MTTKRSNRSKARPGEVFVLTTQSTVRDPGSLVQAQFNTAGGGWVYVTFRAIGAESRGRPLRRAEANTVYAALLRQGFKLTEHTCPRQGKPQRVAEIISVDGIRIA